MPPSARRLFASAFNGEVYWPIYLWGATGRGKTCGALSFCDRIEAARFFTVQAVMNSIIVGGTPWSAFWGWRWIVRCGMVQPFATGCKLEGLRKELSDLMVKARRCEQDGKALSRRFRRERENLKRTIEAEEIREAAEISNNQHWNGPQLAVLDEVGLHEPAIDLDYDAVKRFADWRRGAPTIYISNLSPAQLEKTYDERVHSRLCCGSVLQLTGPDQRMERRADAVSVQGSTDPYSFTAE